MFEHKMQESLKNQIIIKDLKHPLTLKYALIYMYSGIISRFQWGQDNELFEDLLHFADKYQISNLGKLLLTRLRQDITPFNVGMALILSNRFKESIYCAYDFYQSKQVALAFLRKRKQLLQFLSSPYSTTLFTQYPDIVKDILISWAEEDTTTDVDKKYDFAFEAHRSLEVVSLKEIFYMGQNISRKAFKKQNKNKNNLVSR
ncbi:hypothetical protein RFI_27138 [Reticulomyxa filosa]|uniref:BTB domain-containing protein n=1 Tax=Reticulomyxa filosa TaxID=46433 RepID=X6M8C1_RETFI|nr:hypothetical protein RFI_27138 [Reticulomyxa filosa]|eukprot:ETO10238.1 hypothetical protein RFI_27138 [Reticulomyxa filosa]